MTAPVLAVPLRPSTFAISSGFGLEPVKYKKDNGTLMMESVAVFRTGTFRDSMGTQNTWEPIHLKQMVDNFDHLRNNKVFDDVPVRHGHPGWLINNTPGTGAVVGWHKGLKVETLKAPHDETEYDFLMADFEILDEDAKAAIDSGLWRNRSSEIGTYLTNAESEHWPVYMGVAYVDIPAVEGLNFSSANGAQAPKVYVMFNQKETIVGDNPSAAPQQGGTPATAPAASQHGAPTAPAQPFVFSVNGASVSDFAAVQAHITALEKFQSDTQEANRKGFVAALATANKIPATKQDSYEKFALGLSSDQYAAWTATFEDVSGPALLGLHGLNGGTQDNAAPAQQAAEQGTAAEIVQLREQVGMHKNAGTPKSAIEKMGSYKRLIALDPTFKL